MAVRIGGDARLARPGGRGWPIEPPSTDRDIGNFRTRCLDIALCDRLGALIAREASVIAQQKLSPQIKA